MEQATVAAAAATVKAEAAKPTSRLAQMQMRYQQRAQIERDQKKTELTATTRTTAAHSLAAIDLGSSLGAGKVRQMFDERRQKTAGIDKSYPLQPIAAATTTTAASSSSSSTASTTIRRSPMTTRNLNNNTNGNNSRSNNYKGAEGDGIQTNGNYMLQADFLDNEQFPDEALLDDELDHHGPATGILSRSLANATTTTTKSSLHYCSNNNNGNSPNIMSTSLKLPTVRKQLSNMSIKAQRQPQQQQQQQPTGRLAPVALSTSSSVPIGTAAGRKLAAPTGIRKLEPMRKSVPAKAPVSGVGSTGERAAGPGLARKVPAPATNSRLTLQLPRNAAPEVADDAAETPKSTASMSSNRSTARLNSGPQSAVATPKRSPPRSGAEIAATAEPTSATGNSSSSSKFGPPPAGMAGCSICGRHFNADRLAKHESICAKTAAKKRKIFDATTHRIKGTDAENFVRKQLRTQRLVAPAAKGGAPPITAAAVAKLAATTTPPPKRSDWRRKHEEFIAAIRSAKQVQQHLAKGGKLSDLPPPPPSENPDYVQCPHCQRRFNSTAAERHIPKCATFQHNKPKPAASRSTRKY